MSTNTRLSTQAKHCDHDANDGTRNPETREQNGERHSNSKMRVPPIYNPVTVIYFATPSDANGRVCNYNHDVTDFTEVATRQNAGESPTAVIAETILANAPCVKTQVAHQQRNWPEKYVLHDDTLENSVTSNAHEVLATTDVSSMISETQRGKHSTIRQLPTDVKCKLHNVFTDRQTKVTLASAVLDCALCTEPRLVDHPETFHCTIFDEEISRRMRQTRATA